MNSTIWFLLHLSINAFFFIITYYLGEVTEYYYPKMAYDAQWLQIRVYIPEALYLMLWVGSQIYYVVYKKRDQVYLYFMFAILAFAVSRTF
jgi:hypothetical protein